MSQNHTITRAAENLIHEHFDLEPSLAQVIWLNPSLSTEVRLLEINPETFPSGMVQSFYFPPSDEIPCAMFLAEVRPEEWQKILRHEIPLPEGWTLENYKTYSREAVAA